MRPTSNNPTRLRLIISAFAEFVDFMQHSYLCVAALLGCSLRKVSTSCAKKGDFLRLWKMSLCRGVFYLQGPQEQSDTLAYPGTSMLGMTIFVSINIATGSLLSKIAFRKTPVRNGDQVLRYHICRNWCRITRPELQTQYSRTYLITALFCLSSTLRKNKNQ